MECNQIPPAETWVSFSDQQIRKFRNHLKNCPACRRRILLSAPDLLLDELQSEPMPGEFWLGFWDSLDKKLPERAPAVERNCLPLMPVARWAAVFAFTALMILFSQHLSESPSSPRGGLPARPTYSSVQPAAELQPEPSSAYPLVEEIQNPKATYYIIQAENDQKIVMMFDPDMDL